MRHIRRGCAASPIHRLRVRTAIKERPLGLPVSNLQFERMTRRPQRVSITVADSTHKRLQALSDEQGRSLSNLASYLLEQALEQLQQQRVEELRTLQKPRLR